MGARWGDEYPYGRAIGECILLRARVGECISLSARDGRLHIPMADWWGSVYPYGRALGRTDTCGLLRVPAGARWGYAYPFWHVLGICISLWARVGDMHIPVGTCWGVRMRVYGRARSSPAVAAVVFAVDIVAYVCWRLQPMYLSLALLLIVYVVVLRFTFAVRAKLCVACCALLCVAPATRVTCFLVWRCGSRWRCAWRVCVLWTPSLTRRGGCRAHTRARAAPPVHGADGHAASGLSAALRACWGYAYPCGRVLGIYACPCGHVLGICISLWARVGDMHIPVGTCCGYACPCGHVLGICMSLRARVGDMHVPAGT